MTSLYQRGAAFERWVQDYLQEREWVVCRSAGSRSPYDLMALPMDHQGRRPVLIQCRKHDTGTAQERGALLVLAEVVGAEAIWVYRLKNGKNELRFKHILRYTVEPWSP